MKMKSKKVAVTMASLIVLGGVIVEASGIRYEGTTNTTNVKQYVDVLKDMLSGKDNDIKAKILQINKLKNSLEKLRVEKNSLTTEKDNYYKKIKELETKITELENEIKTKQAEIDSKKTNDNTEIARLESEVKKANEDTLALEEYVKKAKDSVNSNLNGWNKLGFSGKWRKHFENDMVQYREFDFDLSDANSYNGAYNSVEENSNNNLGKYVYSFKISNYTAKKVYGNTKEDVLRQLGEWIITEWDSVK